jgi:hypothetical protein
LRLAIRLPIIANFLLGRIDAGAKLGDGLPIDFYASGANVFFTVPPTPQPSRGQDFLQSVTARG